MPSSERSFKLLPAVAEAGILMLPLLKNRSDARNGEFDGRITVPAVTVLPLGKTAINEPSVL